MIFCLNFRHRLPSSDFSLPNYDWKHYSVTWSHLCCVLTENHCHEHLPMSASVDFCETLQTRAAVDYVSERHFSAHYAIESSDCFSSLSWAFRRAKPSWLRSQGLSTASLYCSYEMSQIDQWLYCSKQEDKQAYSILVLSYYCLSKRHACYENRSLACSLSFWPLHRLSQSGHCFALMSAFQEMAKLMNSYLSAAVCYHRCRKMKHCD